MSREEKQKKLFFLLLLLIPQTSFGFCFFFSFFATLLVSTHNPSFRVQQVAVMLFEVLMNLREGRASVPAWLRMLRFGHLPHNSQALGDPQCFLFMNAFVFFLCFPLSSSVDLSLIFVLTCATTNHRPPTTIFLFYSMVYLFFFSFFFFFFSCLCLAGAREAQESASLSHFCVDGHTILSVLPDSASSVLLSVRDEGGHFAWRLTANFGAEDTVTRLTAAAQPLHAPPPQHLTAARYGRSSSFLSPPPSLPPFLSLPLRVK
jgi:hypothetical protein